MVPNGWERKPLEKVAEIKTGVAKGKKGLKDPIEVPYLRVANVQDGHIDLSEIKTIKIERHQLERYSLQVGDVLMTEGGDFDKLGRGDVWQGQITPCLNQNHVFAVRPNNKILLPYFLAALSGSNYGKTYFLSCAKRSTNLASINSTQLKEFPVLLPPLPEQRKIAKTLSKWDEAISTTKKLIETCKQQKKALMQQLLTGKKRLMNPASGRAFDDVWEYVRAGNVFLTRSNKKHNSDLPILAITQDQGAIPRDFIDYKVSVTSDSISGYKVVEPGDFIISLRSFQGGIEYSRYKGICSPAYVILYPKLEIVDTFYKYHLKSHSFIQAMKSRLEGIRDGKIISYKYFSEIKLPQPSLDEQEKIASVLTAADKEIEVLEAKLAHFKQEKKALMQQLLTGKRRVKVNLDMEIAI